MSDAIRSAFDSAVAAGKSADEVKVEMIKAGCQFKDAVKLYKEWGTETGIVVNTKERAEKAAEILSGFEAFDTNESRDEAINALIDGLSVEAKSAGALLRAYAKKNEMEVAKKTRGAGGGAGRSGFASKFYVFLEANPSATEAEAAAFINGEGDHEETSANVQKHASHYQAIRALVNKVAA